MTRNVEKALSLGARESKRECVPLHSMRAYGDGGIGPLILINRQKKNVARMILKCVLERQVLWARTGFRRPRIRLTGAFCEHGSAHCGSKNEIVLIFV